MLSRKVVSKVIQMVPQSKFLLKADKRRNRKKQLEFFAGELEKRQLLATFSFDSGNGLLAIETDTDNEILSIVSTSAYGNYTISSSVSFSGENSLGNITGNTTSNLDVLGNSALTAISITNNAANSGSAFYFGDSLGNSFINNLTVVFSNASSGQITVANSSIFSNDTSVNLSTSGSNVVVTANLSTTGIGTLQLAGESVSVNSDISSSNGVAITANALDVSGNITVSHGSVDIYSNNSIDLGTENPGNLSLTNLEVNRIYGLGLTIISPVATNVIVTDQFNPLNVSDLTIDAPEISVNANLTAQNSLMLRTSTLQINATTSTANISGTGIAIWSQTPIDLGTESAGNLSLTNSEMGLISTSELNIFTYTDSLAVTGYIFYGGNITLSSGLDLVESGSGCLTLAGSALFFSDSGSVMLSNPLNNFSTVGVTALGNITVNDVDSLIMGRFTSGNSTINSNLNVSANGRISQIGETAVTGTANFIATGCITLENPNNDFAIIAASGSDVVILDRSADGLALGLISAANLTVTGLTGNIIQSDSANVSSGTASFTACGVITLDHAQNNFQIILANGTDVTIRDLNAIILDSISADNLSVNADGISQSSSANVTAASNFVSASTIILNQASNDLGDVTSNGVLTVSNGVIRSLNPVGGNVTISGGNISSTTTTLVDFHQTGGTVFGLVVTNGTSNLSGGSFIGEANITGGLLLSSVNLGTLVVGASGTANLNAGNLVAVTNAGTVNVFGATIGSLNSSGTSILTGGNVTGLTSVTGGTLESNVSLNNLTISGGSANLSSGSVSKTELQSGNLTSSATLADLTVLNGIANLTSGSAQILTQHGGTLINYASIIGNAELSGGDTYIDSAGFVNGTTTITGLGNLTSNGSLGVVLVNSASSLANLTGGSVVSLSNNGGTILSSANVTGNNTINGGTTTINNDGNVSGTTTVIPTGSSFSVLNSSGNLTTLDIGTNGTASVSGGLVSGVVTLDSCGSLSTSGTANLAGVIQINGGTANLSGIQSGSLNINGTTAVVTLNSSVIGLTTVTQSNSSQINTSTGALKIDGANANVAFGTGSYNIGSTTVSGNVSIVVPANITLASLTQSNGTLDIQGNVTGLTNLTTGTMNSFGVLGNLTVGGGIVNLTGGSANVTIVSGGTLLSAANLSSLNVITGTANITGGSVSGITTSNDTLNISTQIANLIVNSGNATVLLSGNVTGPVSAVGGNLTVNIGGQIQDLTVLGSTVENNGTILNGVSVTGGSLQLLFSSTQSGNFTVSGTGSMTSNSTIGGTLVVLAGTATILGSGVVLGTSNVSGAGLITSNGALNALDVLVNGVANITGGSTTVATSAGILNLTGGSLNSLQVSSGTSNISGGTVTNLVDITGGSLVSNRTLGYMTVSGGTANLTGGILSNLTQSGGDIISVANINGFVGLTGGNTTINDGGSVGGTTTINGGNLTANASLADLDVSAGTAILTGGLSNAVSVSGGNLISAANLSSLSVTLPNQSYSVNITAGTIAGDINITGGAVNLGGTQLGNLTVNGMGAGVVIHTPIAGLTTATASCLTLVQANLTDGLLINGDYAGVFLDPAFTISIGATTVSANVGLTVPANSTLASLTQSNGTIGLNGNLTGLANITGGTLNSTGEIGSLTVSGVSPFTPTYVNLNGGIVNGNSVINDFTSVTNDGAVQNGTVSVYGGTYYLVNTAPAQPGPLNINGANAMVTIDTPVTGLITLTESFVTEIRSSTGDLLVDGANAHLSFNSDVISVGNTTVTANALFTVPSTTTLASLTQSNGTVTMQGNVTGLSDLSGGTLNSNGVLGDLTVGSSGTANLTGGSQAGNVSSGGTLITAISLSNATVSGGSVTVTAGTTSITAGSSASANVIGGNLISSANLTGLTVHSLGTANISAGTIGATTNVGTLNATGGTFDSIASSNITNLNVTGGTASVTGLSNVTAGVFTANATLGNLTVASGATANLTAGSANVVNSAGVLNSTAVLSSLAVSAGTSTLTGGSVTNLANVTGGLLVSAVNLGTLTVGNAGTANISAGSIGATNTSGTSNATGGTFASINSSNTTNLNAATVTGLSNVTAGTFTANATLGAVQVSAGTVNLTGGTASNLTQSGGTVTSVANITGFANLTGGTTAINNGGNVGGTTTVSSTGNLAANASLNALVVNAGNANLLGGTATNLTQSGGTVTSIANITGVANLTGGTTAINNGGIIGGTTTVNNGNLTSSGSLNEGLQLTAGIATLNGGSVSRTGNNSAIVVNNGTFTAHNTTINGATGATANTPAVYISGGTVELGNVGTPGNNTLTLGNGARYLLFNNATANVSAIGNTWNGVNTATGNLSQLYDTVDRIIDSVDVASLGLVRIKANNVYVTKESFFAPLGTTAADVQRGVDIATVGDIVNVEAGDYNVTDNPNNGVVSVSKNLTISGDGVVVTSVRAFVLNNGSNITTWSGISATSNVTIHSGAVINNATATPTLVSLIDSNGSLIFDSGASFASQLNVVNKNLTITSNTSASAATITTIGSGAANTAISLSGTGNVTLTDLTLGGSGSALNATNTGSLTINRLALNAGLANLTTGVKGAIANIGSFIYNGQTTDSIYTFNSTGMSTSWFNSQFLSLSPSGNVTINSFAGNDNFTIDRIMLTTTINGGAGNDVFSLGTTSPTSNTSSVTVINGEAGNNTLNAPMGRANVFTLTGNGNGTLNTSNVTGFTSMENLNGGTMGDTVVVTRGAVFTSITGGGGIDTIQVDSNSGDTVNMTISGTNTGNITGTGGTSVSVYTGISHLIGTAGNDTFKFIDNASLLTGSLNGGTGTNAINYTGTTKPTFVNLATGQATGVTTTTNTGVVANIQDLFGGTGNDYFNGSSAANVMDGGSGNDTLMGLAGNDILVGNLGADLINGGAGYDILIGGFIDFVSTIPNVSLQTGLQTIMTSWIGVTTNDLFATVSNTLNTASSSQYRLVGDTSLASTYLLQTVFNDQATDTLIDIASSSIPNWFFATERVTQGNDVVQAGTTFTVSKKTVTSKSGRTAR